MKGLTARQREIMEYIIAYRDTNNISPTFREIAEYFDISLQAVQNIVERIRKKGLLMWENGKARTIKQVLRHSY
jgi:SOS-response transcriptional repressor LexA